MTSEFPQVHLGIDWQTNYLAGIGHTLFSSSNGRISTTQPTDLKKEAVINSRKMFSEGTPTIWVAMMLRSNPHFLQPARKMSPYTLQRSRLAVAPTADEWVGNKHGLSSFSNPLLHPLLQKWKAKKLIMTGSETGKCLAASVSDALILGYEVDVNIKLTTDHELAGVPQAQFDEANRVLLERYLKKYGVDTTRLQIIGTDGDKEKPALPEKVMPVLNHQKAYG